MLFDDSALGANSSSSHPEKAEQGAAALLDLGTTEGVCMWASKAEPGNFSFIHSETCGTKRRPL